MYTKREAAHLLGIDRNTLAKWATECGITTITDPRDKRLHLLSDDHLRIIRERYADRHIFSASSADRPHITRIPSADLEARVAELERQVAALLARYDGNLPMASLSTVYTPPKRVTATTVSYKHNPERPPVSAGKMSLPTWVKLHAHLGVKQGTVEHWRDVGKLPMERGKWMEGATRIDYVLTLEGRRIAHQLAHLPWPCERCMEVEEETNETPHT